MLMVYTCKLLNVVIVTMNFLKLFAQKNYPQAWIILIVITAEISS